MGSLSPPTPTECGPIAATGTSTHPGCQTSLTLSIASRYYRHTWAFDSLSSHFSTISLCCLIASVTLPCILSTCPPAHPPLPQAQAPGATLQCGPARAGSDQAGDSTQPEHNHTSMRPRRVRRERPAGRGDSQPVTDHASMRPSAYAGINDLHPRGVPPTPAVQHHG